MDAPERTALLGQTIRIPDHVVFRSFVAETVALNLETGTYYGFQPIGGRFLEVLERTRDISSAASALAAEFDQPVEVVEHDVCEFCSGLAERGLVEIVEPPAEG